MEHLIENQPIERNNNNNNNNINQVGELNNNQNQNIEKYDYGGIANLTNNKKDYKYI